MPHFEKFVFFEPKNVLFVVKKLDFFPKTRKVANLLYNAYQLILYLKKFFSALIVRFFARNEKVCEVGEIREYDEETVYFQKKRFDLSKSLLYENGKAENMPVAAGRSVSLRQALADVTLVSNIINFPFQFASYFPFFLMVTSQSVKSFLFSKRFGVLDVFIFRRN